MPMVATHLLGLSRALARYVFAAALASITASSASASAQFLFEGSSEGWQNQSTEPFLVQFAPAGGLSGGGLLIYATTPRDSFQLVHELDTDWPAIPLVTSAVVFDVHLATGVALDLHGTGALIRGVGGPSVVYTPEFIAALGDGWLRVQLASSQASELPGTHADTGINLHLATTSALSDAPVAWLDNIAFVPRDSLPPVPEPTKATLMGAALLIFGFIQFLRRWRG